MVMMVEKSLLVIALIQEVISSSIVYITLRLQIRWLQIVLWMVPYVTLPFLSLKLASGQILERPNFGTPKYSLQIA